MWWVIQIGEEGKHEDKVEDKTEEKVDDKDTSVEEEEEKHFSREEFVQKLKNGDYK